VEQSLSKGIVMILLLSYVFVTSALHDVQGKKWRFLLHFGFLLGVFFDSEDGRLFSSEMAVDFKLITLSYPRR
jgi:hypothetical protein